MPTVAQCLVGPPILERSKVMTQMKMDTLVPPGWGLGMKLTTSPHKKKLMLTKPQKPQRGLINETIWLRKRI
jgi:hypothetical protein